jgi:hypothetical protein
MAKDSALAIRVEATASAASAAAGTPAKNKTKNIIETMVLNLKIVLWDSILYFSCKPFCKTSFTVIPLCNVRAITGEAIKLFIKKHLQVPAVTCYKNSLNFSFVPKGNKSASNSNK